MKFRSRIMVVYTVFSLFIMIIFTGTYYCLNKKNVIEKECRNVEVLSVQMSRQYEEMLNFMETAYSYIVKDINALEAIRQLSKLPEDIDYTTFYFEEATNTLQQALLSDYIYSNFRRVAYFNQGGVVLTSLRDRKKLDFTDISTLDWIEKTENVPYGTFYVRGVHRDDWGNEGEEVFSIVKKIQGDNRGYIEVQKSLEELKELFLFSELNTRIILFDEEKKVLFCSDEENGSDGYAKLISGGNLKAGEYFNESTGRREFAAGVALAGGSTLLVIKSSEDMKNQLQYILWFSFMFAFIFISAAVLFIYVSARHLTRPVDELRQLMTLTELNPTEGRVELKSNGNEFKIMGEHYQRVLNHLNKAMEKEKRITISQLQAQFDALQAQVNPHFIYNVLNVISARGMLDGDEVICDICDDLASILRYSTDTRERYATIGQECTYLKSYFKLLKGRYEHKLEYEIHISAGTDSKIIPKLVLQQFAENSVLHGFEQKKQVMRIEVYTWQDETGWYVRVRDNGDGFTEEALRSIRDNMEKFKKQMKADGQNCELRIGGMGIANTYARLYLLYSEKLKFCIGNHEHGAEILLGEVKEGRNV